MRPAPICESTALTAGRRLLTGLLPWTAAVQGASRPEPSRDPQVVDAMFEDERPMPDPAGAFR